MSQEQNKTISGSIWDTYTEQSQEFKENRMPRVGQTVEFEDGRKYLFVSTAVDLAVTNTVAAAPPVDYLTDTEAAAGQRVVPVVAAGIAANAWAGGTLQEDLGGYCYKIKSNTAPATIGGVANVVLVTVYDAIQMAIPAALDVQVSVLQASGVVLGTDLNNIKGFAHVPSTAATSGLTNYLWIQYQGLGSIPGALIQVGSAFAGAAAGAITTAIAGQVILGQNVADQGNNNGLAYFMIDGGC